MMTHTDRLENLQLIERAIQGGTSLSCGSEMESPWCSRSKPRRNPEMNGWPHINGHAGDADVVSTVFSSGNSITFVECSEVAEWAPLMAVPLCGFQELREEIR